MNDIEEDTALDAALRTHLQREPEPDDAGFSLRVMAALPPAAAPARQRWVRWVRRAQWLALSLAACGAAALLSGSAGPLDGPHAVAAAALVGLLIYWSVPSRWTRR